jgi:hypothetical protein
MLYSNLKLKGSVVLFIIVLMTGCASYRPASLPILHPEFAPYSETVDGVTLVAKTLTQADCKNYFDRGVISKGYVPIQLSVHNDTKYPILFSPQGIGVPTVPAKEVAGKVHTSTAGRAGAYGIGAVCCLPLAVPAVIDGVGSSRANQELDRDFNEKAAGQAVIEPHGTHNGVIFVLTSDYVGAFNVTMTNRETKQKLLFQVCGLPSSPL